MESQDEMIAFARKSLGLSQEVKVELSPFTGRGSDRAYFRFRWNHEDSAILVHYQMSRIENAYYADIAGFLLENEISVPRIFRHDTAGCLILMEDLGKTDLWTLRYSPWKLRRSLYQKTLTIAHRLHSIPERIFPSERVTLMEACGPGFYRWERDYFRDNFIGVLCGIGLKRDFEQALEAELSGLAEKLMRGNSGLMHRDLQSQNVMIYRDEPFLIDFQGMRFGNPYYDLGSLLCDPYVPFADREREELLSFYYGLSDTGIDWDSFQGMFWNASVQRLMQALGCYGFLGITKGLRNYLVHVPAGLRNLRLAAENADSFPRLLEICARCSKALEDSKFESQISEKNAQP